MLNKNILLDLFTTNLITTVVEKFTVEEPHLVFTYNRDGRKTIYRSPRSECMTLVRYNTREDDMCADKIDGCHHDNRVVIGGCGGG